MRSVVTAELRAISRRDLVPTALSGLWMAIHFVLWISSLEHVGVLIATVLVTSSPIWTALLEIGFLKAKITRALLIGLGAVIAGNVIIALAGGNTGVTGTNPVLGGTLAVSAAMAIAVQRTIGRGVRTRVRLVPFIWLLFSSAAFILLIIVILTGTPITGYSEDAYFWVLMLTIFPQLIGHSSFNYALRYMPATYVSLAIQVEPVIATLIALLLFHEIPVPLQVIGSAVILSGVVIATKRGTRRPAG
ncbi:MAG: DMT family transporter [Anaerolineae bacterium]